MASVTLPCSCCSCKACMNRDESGQWTQETLDCPPFGDSVCVDLFQVGTETPLGCAFGDSFTLPYQTLNPHPTPELYTTHGNPSWQLENWYDDGSPIYVSQMWFKCGGPGEPKFRLYFFWQPLGGSRWVTGTADWVPGGTEPYQSADCETGCLYLTGVFQCGGFSTACIGCPAPYDPVSRLYEFYARVCPCASLAPTPLGLTGTASATFTPADPSSSFNSPIGRWSGVASVSMSEVGPGDLAGERTVGRLGGEATVVQGTSTSDGGRVSLAGLADVRGGVVSQSSGRIALGGVSLALWGTRVTAAGTAAVSGLAALTVTGTVRGVGRVGVSGAAVVSVSVGAEVEGVGRVVLSGVGTWWVADQFGTVIGSNDDDHPVIIED